MALAMTGVLLFAAGCSDDGESPVGSGVGQGEEGTPPDDGGGEEPPAEEPPAEEPPAEEAPPEEPPAEEPPPDEGGGTDPGTEPEEEDDGLTTEQWVALILLGILLIAIIAAIAGAAGRRSDNKAQSESDRQRLDGVRNSGRWAHDQAALSVLNADPSVLASTWSQVQSQMMSTEASINATYVQSAQNEVGQVGRGVSDLRVALGAYVTAATADQPDQNVVQSTRQTALQRNENLDAALVALTNAYS